MVRVILSLNWANHVNMKKERDEIKMLSENQMAVYHTVMECFWSTSKEIEYAQRKTFREKCSKQWYVCARNPPKKLYRFLLYWTETVQYNTIKHKRSKDNRWLQNQVEVMYMEEHPLINWLVLKLTKKHLHIYIYSFHCCLNPLISLCCTIE